MTVADAIRAATDRLSATSDTARLDAELLMAHALGVSRSEMLLRATDHSEPVAFDALVDRRAAHEPVAYIVGETEFYGLGIAVDPGVLIPRGDSETLIGAAREAFHGREPPSEILDLGTGSGALLIAALSVFPDAFGTATDRSGAVAKSFLANLDRHGDGKGISFVLNDWNRQGWADGLGRFDLILCNPPYVESDAKLDPDVRDHEPASALFAGKDGLDDYRVLVPQVRKLMTENAVAIFEIGATQADSVGEIAQDAGFSVEIRNDLANRPRCAVLR
ncbi:MAG: peptide chain release factor N(5)-glutamine methyltransferase [Erythrobacter sp.]|nr:peptide chain release factor N(5)-glutamine methyltransferase [Erythrobacter sp.]